MTEKSKNYAVLFFFVLFWVVILGFSGSIFSGFHFTDDHEIIGIKYELNTQSTMSVAMNWMKNDQLSSHRFRPFYFFHRVLETKVFGSNFTAWSVYTASLAIATSFLLFYFLILLRFSFWESFLFSLVSLVGPQAAIWWRLGPNETIGMFLLSASLLFLGLFVTKKEHGKIFKFFFVIFAILSALSKESFLLLLPAFVFLLLYFSHERKGLEWRESIRQNIVSMGMLLVVFAGLILYIKLFLGTGGMGYAGIDGFNLESYVKTFWSLTTSFWLSKIILIQTVLVVIVFWKKRLDGKEKIVQIFRKLIFPMILFFAIVISQVVLYAKSGFFERYFLPVILGYAVIFICLLRQLGKNKKSIWAGLILLALFFVCGDVANEFKNARGFAQEGRDVGGLFNIVKAKTNLDDNFLIVGDPAMHYEWAVSINYYLKDELGRNNLYIYPLMKNKENSYSNFEKGLISGFGAIYGKNRYENNIDKNYDVIIVFPKIEKTFLNNFPNIESIKEGDFTRKKSGEYVIYYKIKKD